jgi:inorganic pyrophosphatase
VRDIDPEFGDGNTLRVVVETPRGSRHKYAWNEEIRAFELRSTLPSGMAWPYDYGFIPRTKGEDGDPLDVLVLMDDATFPGCILRVRLIGAFKVEKNGKRNDRYVGCLLPSKETSLSTDGYESLKDLPEQLLQEMETFLQMYSVQKGNEVRILGRMGPNRSIEAVKSAAS